MLTSWKKTQSLAITLEERLESLVLDNPYVKAARGTLRDAVNNTAMECIAPTLRRHKNWFDNNCEEITPLLEGKHRAYTDHLYDPLSTAKKDALRNTRSHIQQILH